MPTTHYVSKARQKEVARQKLTPVIAPPSAAPPARPAGSFKQQIDQLTALRQAGVLTEAEFEAAQQRLLAAAGL